MPDGGINQYKIFQVLGIYNFHILICELFQMYYLAFLGHPLAQKLNPVVGIFFSVIII
jgi:hypothetical protein